MINRQIKLFIIIILIVFNGCIPFKRISNEKTIDLSEENIDLLIGAYSNRSIDTLESCSNSFWSQINYMYYQTDEWNNSVVQINVLSKKRLKATLFCNGQLIKERIVKGKIKDGYFYKRRVFYAFIFPIGFAYRNAQVRFGLSNEKLFIDNASFKCGFFLIAGGTEEIKTSNLYLRK